MDTPSRKKRDRSRKSWLYVILEDTKEENSPENPWEDGEEWGLTKLKI